VVLAEISYMTTDSGLLTTAIFALTYFGLALGRIPGLRIDRAGIALVGAAAMLSAGALGLHHAARAVDYETIVFLFGMMVVVAYLKNVVHTWGLDRWPALRQSPVVMVNGLSLALSNLVSNVPGVMLFKPLIEGTPQAEQAWLALAMSSTLAGNLTLLGSVANLIVVESARRCGAKVGFFDYLKVGIPLTLLTTAMGVTWLVVT
jgi:Na+/H+ antiporter NhaD/arsenite permease-like protein